MIYVNLANWTGIFELFLIQKYINDLCKFTVCGSAKIIKLNFQNKLMMDVQI